jgi:hypothetical protein
MRALCLAHAMSLNSENRLCFTMTCIANNFVKKNENQEALISLLPRKLSARGERGTENFNQLLYVEAAALVPF